MSEILGKADQQMINKIKKYTGHNRPDVIAGPGFGVDVSLVDIPGNMVMAMTSDPLSLIPSLGLEESAWLSVHLMANDMATTGFAPQFGQFVLNLPAGFTKQDFETYWNYIHKFCDDIGAAITGGHTGFIEGQNSTISGGGTFTTIADKPKVKLSSNARKGHKILVTKACAMSSAAILAKSFPEKLTDRLGKEAQIQTEELFFQTSSLQDALTAVATPGIKNSDISAMHDVTEGGVLGAIYELAIASGNGVRVDNEKIPKNQNIEQVCSVFDLDSRYIIGAGSMIICCAPEASEKISSHLQENGIRCSEVGELTEENEGIKVTTNGKSEDIIYFEEDPYWAAFFNALKSGWK
ncbi:AIR synthase-related protein [Mangrovivirga sp. M17]|uniref:AIR synthase-related protein n=1 Tax=Mangrovivirga halotolerans TaxID=2993936 RepID=A0ABT3RLT2_9BACT|nr:AIR synthase-related protein [Mangrovivirga halotolerans]MCX2742769.1 AIR synthase-related protein [Mangrovivirga halotolerans]